MAGQSQITISQNLNVGDKVEEDLGAELIIGGDVTSWDISDLENNKEIKYAYDLTASYDYQDEVYTSDRSNRIEVTLNTSGIDDIMTSAKTTISARGLNINVSLNESKNIQIYTADGVLVSHSEGVAGNNQLHVASPGIYIVVVGTDKAKVICQ